MRKLQKKIIDKSNTMNLTDRQKELVMDETFEVVFYKFLLDCFENCNKRDILPDKSCDFALEIYHRFSKYNKNVRTSLYSSFLPSYSNYHEKMDFLLEKLDNNSLVKYYYYFFNIIFNGGSLLFLQDVLLYIEPLYTGDKYSINAFTEELTRYKLSVLSESLLFSSDFNKIKQYADNIPYIELIEQYSVQKTDSSYFSLMEKHNNYLIFLKKYSNKISWEKALEYDFNLKEINTYLFESTFSDLFLKYPYTTDAVYSTTTDTENHNKIQTLLDLKIEVVADIPCYSFAYYYSGQGLNFTFYKYSNIIIRRGENFYYRGGKINKELHIFISLEGSIIQGIKLKTGGMRYIPLQFKKLAEFYDVNDKNYVTFVNELFLWMGKRGSFLAKDIKPYIENSMFLPVLSVNDVFKYHSFQNAFYDKYAIKKNWNKNNINLLYALVKSSYYVTDMSKGVLLNYTDKEILKRAKILSNDSFQVTKYNYLKNGVFKLLLQWYIDRFSFCHTDILKDYLKIAFISKEKINLNFLSIKKLEEEHDRLSEKAYMKKTPTVNIPTKSKFINLRRILPSEFEWIKTRKRLIHETQIQKHCVWSYADNINSDISAIYSFIYQPEDKRYTIEFHLKNNHYIIKQMQSRFNNGYSEEAYNYVNNFILPHNNMLKIAT